MCRSPNYEVKRAAVKCLGNLATSDYSKEEIVNSGGVRHLFSLTVCKDENTKRKAARVLLKLSSHWKVHDKFLSDPHTIRCTILLLLECPDITIRRDMIQMVANLASNDARKLHMVNGDIIGPLLRHLDPTHSSLETISLVFQVPAMSFHVQ